LLTLRPSSTSRGKGDLMSRLWFTMGALVIYRLGKHVPLPGLDPSFLQRTVASASITPVSLCVLGVYPYITTSFWLLVLNAIWRGLRRRGRPTAAGERLLDQVARFAALFLAAMQGYALAVGFETAGFTSALVADSGVLFETMTTAAIVVTTGVVIWLAEQITRRGLANGVGLILFSDLVARLPSSFGSLPEELRVGLLSPQFLILFLGLVVVVVAGVVFIESARRLVTVQYAPRLVGTTAFPGASSYLRLKLNNFGIIPAVFASGLMLLPATLSGFDNGGMGRLGAFTRLIGRGHPAYLALYAVLIIALAFGYRTIILNPREMAEALQRHGGVISDREPGAPTAEYLGYLLRRLTAIGAVYVAALCLLPEILITRFFYFGASSLLLVVCISLDLVTAMRAHSARPDASN
jgi:preprotein translocase subunit SecY